MSNPIKILAFDTATDGCSVAIYCDGNIHSLFQLILKAHTRLLLPMIDSLLKSTDLKLNDFDAFAFGRGPGSFTGVRIATSVAQALGFGIDRPLVPVSTLRAIAQGAYRKSQLTKVFAHLDARMQEHYWGLFEVDEKGIMQHYQEEHVGKMDTLGFDAWCSVTGFPEAQDIVRIAVADFISGKGIPVSQALPTYLRDEVVKKNTL